MVNRGRYARQELIQDWNQDTLAQAHVVIVGSDFLAGFVGWGLAALGIGQLTLIDDRVLDGTFPRFPGLEGTAGQLSIEALEYTLSRINSQITVRGIRLKLLYDAHLYAIPDCDIIVEATNGPQSKEICLEYMRRKGVPVILASAGDTCGECTVVTGQGQISLDNHRAYHRRRQSATPSQVIGALVLEEIRKLLLPLSNDQPANGLMRYNQVHPRRFGNTSQLDALQIGPSVTPRHCLIIGAGALGTYVGLGLALNGITRLTIVDPDMVEETNLNRQVLFYDAIGQPKATMLAEQLNRLCPYMETIGLVAPVTEEHFQGVDLALSCVDNFETRAYVNELASQCQVSLINGGTSPFTGEVMVYQPGKTACLDCHLGVNDLAEAEAGSRARCGDVPEASIVISNQLIGGLMAGEAQRLLQPETFGEPLAGIIEYDAFQPARLGIRSPRPPCRCHLRRNNECF